LRIAASSAFPAFFPSVKLNARDLGLDNRQFSNAQFFTDGGVFDNLGIRKFMWLLGGDGAAMPDQSPVDVVFLSDAGRGFDWATNTNGSGIFRTVSRSMDIAMIHLDHTRPADGQACRPMLFAADLLDPPGKRRS
jgi:hypothetical protein